MLKPTRTSGGHEMPQFKTNKQKFHQIATKKPPISPFCHRKKYFNHNHPFLPSALRAIPLNVLHGVWISASFLPMRIFSGSIRRKLMAINTECSVRFFLFRLCISKQAGANIHKYLIPFLLIHLFYYPLYDVLCKLINYMFFFHPYRDLKSALS